MMKFDNFFSMGNKIVKGFKVNFFIIFMIIVVIVGFGFGFGLWGVWILYEIRKIFYFCFFGDLLMNMFKMLILFLIVFSFIIVMGSFDINVFGWMGLCIVVYYMMIMFLVVILGIVLVVII